MKKLCACCVVAVGFLLAIGLSGVQSEASVSEETPAAAPAGGLSKSQALAREVKLLQEGLAVKEAELATLRHKWTVSKGRTPTKEEILEFEKERAKGAVKVDDNPYVNKSALSTPARKRAAYFAKLDAITKDKAAIALLEQEIAAQIPALP
jgi:hypothetical protein